MSHLELLVHFSFAVYAPELEEGPLSTKSVLEAALREEYLMLEVLAFSARYLSTIHTDESDRYSRQAVELQTKAIELFNNADTATVDEASLARLLFSSILGRHMLVNVLARRDSDLESFIDRFAQGARVHRGVRAITTAQEWEILLTSKVGPLITKGLGPLGFHDPPPFRPHFMSLLSRTARLNDHDKEAYTKALCMIERSPGRSKVTGARLAYP
ncbi:C6 finger domain-containing protein [Fusarium pseudoanthophilum]|uniref:C6 finger domain-containing protein n=1 Tax=Fusarium pseudoanthophilum TaxID=48495 RepID=A0A8H5L571_9HYPO|nr:C6 finger domain-containing protein [Fusarium pseudoanthophilum]